MKHRFAYLALPLLLALPAPAQTAPTPTPPDDDDWGEEGDDGFGDDDDITISDDDLELEAPKAVSLTGFLRTDVGFWAERFGDDAPGRGRAPWARTRQSLDLVLTGKQDFLRFRLHGHMEYDFRYLGDELDVVDDFDEPTEEVYAFQLLPREALVGFSMGPVELTIGRQIVAWGEGDALSVLDVVNPRDLREPGLADLDDIRMSVLATRLGVFVGAHRIELMVLHEADFGLRSTPLGPFSPLLALIPESAQPLLLADDHGWTHKQDRFAFDQQQPLLRWVYNGPELDIGLYAAYVLDQQGVFELDTGALAAAAADGERGRVDFVLDHPFYGVVGTSGAAAVSSWLFKWELAAKLGRSYNTGDPEAAIPVIGRGKGSTIDVMAAVSYTPFQDLNVALEFTKATFVKKPDELLFEADLPTFALRARYQLLKQRLTLSAGASMFGLTDADDIGIFVRGGVDYEFFDGFEAGVGYIHFSPSENLGFLSGFDEHDQLFMKVRWDVTIL